MRYWEIIADNLKKAGSSVGWVSALDREGRTIWIADAHRDDRKRYVVRVEMYRLIPNAQLAIFPRGDHFMLFQSPDRMLANLVPFFLDAPLQNTK